MSIVEFADNFMTLTFVAVFKVGFNLDTQSTPSKGLNNRIDGSSHSGVTKVGAIPIDHSGLET